MIELELTRSADDRRLYALDRVGTLRFEGFGSRRAEAVAGDEHWRFSRRTFARTIEAAGATGARAGTFAPALLRGGGALRWQGREYVLRPTGFTRQRYELVSGERTLAVVDPKGWGKRPVKLLVGDLDAIEPGLLLFAAFVAHALAGDASASAGGAVAATAVVFVALVAGVLAPGAAPVTGQVPVWFLQGEQLARVSRPGTTPEIAVRRLVAGPTAAERRRGFRTYVPAGTPVHRVTVANGLATVDLGRRFVSRPDEGSMLARLSQLVRTLTGLAGTKRVQLLIDGAPVAGMFPGVPTSGPITFAYLARPNVPVPLPPQLKLPAPEPAVRDMQQRLIELGYMLPGDADGRWGPATQNAVLAFQKWERLDRTGLVDARTKARLATAKRPTPRTRGGAGKRAEVLLDRQVTLLVRDNRLVRAIAVSSGKPSTPTPPGNYRVYARIQRWWSVPFREWLPWAIPFVGGIAFHEFGDMPAYPASHGCVRQSYTVAQWTYAFAEVGMPVAVLARS
jgi:hypothetical protein